MLSLRKRTLLSVPFTVFSFPILIFVLQNLVFASFLPCFCFQQTINDLFAEPSGLQSLVEEKSKIKTESTELQKVEAIERDVKKEESKKETAILTQYEQVSKDSKVATIVITFLKK